MTNVITNDMRNQAFAALPPVLQKMYDASETGEVMSSVYLQHVAQALDEKYIPYAEVISDTILGLHTTAELAGLLVSDAGLTTTTADQVMTALESLLQPVVDHEQGRDLTEDTAQTPDPAILDAAAKSETVSADTAPAPAPAPAPQPASVVPAPTATGTQPASAPAPDLDPHAVQPMRTMGDDVSRVHGYGAYRKLFPDETGRTTDDDGAIRSAGQDDLLGQQKLTSTPTYSDTTDQS